MLTVVPHCHFRNVWVQNLYLCSLWMKRAIIQFRHAIIQKFCFDVSHNPISFRYKFNSRNILCSDSKEAAIQVICSVIYCCISLFSCSTKVGINFMKLLTNLAIIILWAFYNESFLRSLFEIIFQLFSISFLLFFLLRNIRWCKWCYGYSEIWRECGIC